MVHLASLIFPYYKIENCLLLGVDEEYMAFHFLAAPQFDFQKLSALAPVRTTHSCVSELGYFL